MIFLFVTGLLLLASAVFSSSSLGFLCLVFLSDHFFKQIIACLFLNG